MSHAEPAARDAPYVQEAAWLYLDAQGDVRHATRAARALLAAQAGGLQLRQRHLEAPSTPHVLTRMLAQAKPGQPSAAALPRAQRLPLTVLCLRAADASSRLLLRDPEALRCDPALLMSMFELTRAEARVAAALAAGQSTAEIAQATGIKANTVQAHIKNALAKTGTRRQVELVALLLRTAAVVEDWR